VNVPERQFERYEDPVPAEARCRRRSDSRAGEVAALSLGEKTLSLAVDEPFGAATR
jgi:hypothetical protein